MGLIITKYRTFICLAISTVMASGFVAPAARAIVTGTNTTYSVNRSGVLNMYAFNASGGVYVCSAVVDPATIGVRFTVSNNGSKPVSPSCTIRLQNSGGAYHGFDVFSMNPIAPGASVHASGKITITGQGAQFVTQSTTSYTANTSDTVVSSGKSVGTAYTGDQNSSDPVSLVPGQTTVLAYRLSRDVGKWNLTSLTC
jgi:hypothetical protein